MERKIAIDLVRKTFWKTLPLTNACDFLNFMAGGYRTHILKTTALVVHKKYV